MDSRSKNASNEHHFAAGAELLGKGHTTTKPLRNTNIAKQSQAPAQKWQGNKNKQQKAQQVVATLDAVFGRQRRR